MQGYRKLKLIKEKNFKLFGFEFRCEILKPEKNEEIYSNLGTVESKTIEDDIKQTVEIYTQTGDSYEKFLSYKWIGDMDDKKSLHTFLYDRKKGILIKTERSNLLVPVEYIEDYSKVFADAFRDFYMTIPRGFIKIRDASIKDCVDYDEKLIDQKFTEIYVSESEIKNNI